MEPCSAGDELGLTINLEVKIDHSQLNILLIYVTAAKEMSFWYKWITVSLENASDVVSAAYVRTLCFLTIRDVIY